VNVQPTSLPGVLIREPRAFSDDRGFFSESYNKAAFAAATGFDGEFVQDNHSSSRRGVLRGLHYQVPPDEQGKLVRCIRGEVFDVAVDVRRSSAGFGQWAGVVLSEDDHRQLWVPAGFAHGFIAISEVADVVYKTTTYHAPASERSVRWDDPAISIDWPDIGGDPVLADRDAAAPLLEAAEVFL
jgi:dTDP-4-dehydrorhamnose 3,5-epimerase